MSKRARLILAFATVYIVWGSTYFAIRIGVETLPPFLMAGFRFLVAGSILALVSRARGDERPKPIHWRNTAIVALLLLLCGNGGVTWAETHVASGLAALIVAIEPAWVVLMEWRMGMRRRLSLASLFGLVLGLVGVVLLVVDKEGIGAAPLAPCLVIVGGTVAWAYGSLFGRRSEMPESPVQANAMQMLIGGGAMALVGVGLGEPNRLASAHVSAVSLAAFAYLIVFGSLIAFTAYTFLMRNAPPTLTATYSYVNPAIAVLLGSMFGEPFNAREAGAMALILVGVIVLTRSESTGKAKNEPVGGKLAASYSDS